VYKSVFKRGIDFLGASFLLIILSPIFIIITMLLTISNKGSAFFYQQRPGKRERIFKIFKFKTMNDLKDEKGELLPDSQRLTKIGKIIRKTSLDEIPQLVNVLKGEMSFIGPRPLLIRYLPYYSEEEQKRHTIRPGITGLAQISGRNLLNWDDRLAKDIKYTEELSAQLDFKIFIKTIMNVLTSKDVAVDANSVMQDLDEYRKN